MISLFSYDRIVAAFLILLIHQHFLPETSFLDGLKGCSVPMFATMAGYLYSGALRSKIRRIVIPYCIWAVIYFVVNNVVLDVFVRGQGLVIPPIKVWLLGGTACHLWFLPSLFAAFTLASVVRLFGEVGERCRLAWGGILLMLGVVTQLFSDSSSETFAGYVHIYFGRLLLFFSIGWMLRQLLRGWKGKKPVVIVGGICTVVGIVNLVVGFLSGLSWRPLPFVIGMIVLSVGCGTFRVSVSVERLAANTMGIYLVHVLFTSAANLLLARCGFGQLPILLGIPLALALFLVSYFCVLLLPKWMKG